MSACEVCAAPTWTRRLLADETLEVCSTCGHVVRLDGHGAARAHAAGGTPPRDDARISLTYRRIRKALGHSNIRRVYEVGYGSGALLRRFLDDGADVAGCDPGMLETELDPEVARRGALTTEPLGAGGSANADLVLAIHVVEHLPDVATSLRSLVEQATSGGTVYVVTPTADCWGAQAFGPDWWMLEDPTHTRFYSDRSLGRALTDAGLNDVRTTRPRLDSLGCDGASLVRRLSGATNAGALGDARGRALSLAAMPLSIAARTAWPRARPVVDAIGRVG